LSFQVEDYEGPAGSHSPEGGHAAVALGGEESTQWQSTDTGQGAHLQYSPD